MSSQSLRQYFAAVGVLLFMAGTSLWGEEGIRFELIVRQKPAGMDKHFEITRDTVEVVQGGRQYCFLVNFGLDIELVDFDTSFVEFTAHLVTVGKTPHTDAERFRIEYNLPGRLENIPGKNGSYYQLLISPRERVAINTACPIRVDSAGQFATEPSAYFDIYYVPGTLGDFRWTAVKAYLEVEYQYFRQLFHFESPGKLKYYLCPCPLDEIRWDKRFGYAIDPGRLQVFALYSPEFISSEAILTNMTRLMRQWGYAPPILVEGLAGQFEFIPYESKKLLRENKFPPLKTLLTTSGYYKADAESAELAAASFVKYLLETYTLGKFQQLYELSDDLTLPLYFEEIYGQPLDSLEQGWRQYIDTVGLRRTMFEHYSRRAGALYKMDKQLEYFEAMTEYDKTRGDSIATGNDLSLAYYHAGRYYDAEKGYLKLLEIDSSRALYWQIIGNLRLINGDYDRALTALEKAFLSDSVFATSYLLTARIRAIRGDTAAAIKLAEEYYPRESSTPGKIEFLLFLGSLYGEPGENYDSVKARRCNADALAWTKEVLAKAPTDASYLFRAGQALSGLGEYAEAERMLQGALYLETRAYHLGYITLELGRLYDAVGKRDLALEYYQNCLVRPAAVWHHDLCRRYLDEPYRPK